MMFSKVVEPLQCCIDALGRLSTLLGCHTWSIVIAADSDGSHTCPAETRERIGDKGPILIVRSRSVKEVTRRNKAVRFVKDSMTNRSFKACAQALTALCLFSR
jgi:hypothetical protein